MEEALYFAIRYTPFWGIPVIFIAVPSAYVYWLKDLRKVSLCFFLVALFSFCVTSFWVWAGGPDPSIQHFQRLMTIIFN